MGPYNKYGRCFEGKKKICTLGTFGVESFPDPFRTFLIFNFYRLFQIFYGFIDFFLILKMENQQKLI